MKSLRPLSLTPDETRAVANAIRALGRHLEADKPDPEWERIERLLRDWDSPEIQEVVRGMTAADESRMLGLALRFRALNLRSAARDRQKRSAAKRHKNRAARNRAVCQEYLRWKQKPLHSRRSPESFREGLGEHGECLPPRLRFFKKTLVPNGRLLSPQQFRNILQRVLRAK
jgi:hypothetical protein